MSLKKQYLKTKPICKVTFRLTCKSVSDVKTVQLVGEFNHWSKKKHPMQKLKDGSFKKTLDLETGQEYQYRYLINNEFWENDDGADKYVAAPVGSEENCVVVV